MLTSKKFTFYFFVLCASIIGIAALVNYQIDFYGLFQPSPQRDKQIYRIERAGKYLMSMRYIPENFDTVLLGSSSSLLLDTKKLDGHHIYNASLNGGNVSEMRILLENIVRHKKPKNVILSISPYLCFSTGPKTDLMNPRIFWTAFGSPLLYSEYLFWLRSSLGLSANGFDSYGRYNYMLEAQRTPIEEQIEQAIEKVRKNETGHILPEALNELKDIVQFLRRNGISIFVLYMAPPEEYYKATQNDWTDLKKYTADLFRENEILLDLTRDEHLDFRKNLSNFKDNGHINQGGHDIVITLLHRALSTKFSSLKAE